ncbi:MAG: glycosyltransferase, partial [Myxococcota bacterium]
MTLYWLSPGDPDQRTGGYLWNARIARALGLRGVEVRFVPLVGDWPRPAPAAWGALDAIPSGARVVADGLCWPGLGEAGRRLVGRCRVTVVVHSQLGREGAMIDRELDALERASWSGCAGLVATSGLTAAALGRSDVAVVIPGTAPAQVVPLRVRAPVHLLTVGTLTRRKGHDRLLDALATVPEPWVLRCAGELRDPEWAERVAAQARGFGDRVTFTGALDDAALDAAYADADLVVQAASFEAFGMAIAEAVARGLPVLTPPAGVVDHLPPGAVAITTP